jgi:hypothetical protein
MQGPGVTALSWLPWAAGNFAVANGRSGKHMINLKNKKQCLRLVQLP